MLPEDVYWSGIAGTLHDQLRTTCFLEAGDLSDEWAAPPMRCIRGRIALSTMDMDESIPAGSRFTTDEASGRMKSLSCAGEIIHAERMALASPNHGQTTELTQG